MYYIGIDVGKNGGIAIIYESGDRVTATAVPYSDKQIIDICRILKNGVVAVEKVGAMPKQGVKSMFNFGAEYGYIKGVLDANNMQYVEVTPQKWKKHFGVTSDKQTSIAKAHELFPTVSLRRTDRCRTDSDGMAESLLIAEWGRQFFTKKISQQ